MVELRRTFNKRQRKQQYQQQQSAIKLGNRSNAKGDRQRKQQQQQKKESEMTTCWSLMARHTIGMCICVNGYKAEFVCSVLDVECNGNCGRRWDDWAVLESRVE